MPSESGASEPESREDIVFLSVEQVTALHRRGIAQYSPGESLAIRDPGLLESAVAQPQQTWGGQYLYPDLESMAAAYLIGLNQNHPYENGNKRVAFAACAIFLRMNGCTLTLTNNEAIQLTLDVAAHRISRQQVVDTISKSVRRL